MDTYQNIGFTGTRQVITSAQHEALKNVLTEVNGIRFHHGDCIGADEVAHRIADELGYVIHIYPPKDKKYTANLEGYIRYQPREYLERNHMIVRACDILVAVPSTSQEQLRSGTWATVRYARKLHRPVIIIKPNGEM